MLSIRLIETIIARITTFLIQLMLTKDFNELNFDEVFDKARSAKKMFL